MEKPQTYGQHIKAMEAAINEIYNNAEWLRDVAEGKEKERFNVIRGRLYDLIPVSQRAAGPISEDRWKMKI